MISFYSHGNFVAQYDGSLDQLKKQFPQVKEFLDGAYRMNKTGVSCMYDARIYPNYYKIEIKGIHIWFDTIILE